MEIHNNRISGVVGSSENQRLEYKSGHLLRQPNGKNRYSIAKEMVALANRTGGWVIFGIDDETRQPEGCELDEELSLNTISEIARMKCSPPIKFEHDIFTAEDGDLSDGCIFLIEVKADSDIPHAIIEKKEGEIRKREYRIRSGDESRLISDEELRWLYENRYDPISAQQGSVWYTFDTTDPKSLQVEPSLEILKKVDRYLEALDKNRWREIASSKEKMERLFTEITPFLFLESIEIEDFWLDNFEKQYTASYYQDNILPNTQTITGSEIQYNIEPDTPVRESITSELSLNPLEKFQEVIYNRFLVPEGTEIIISYLGSNTSLLIVRKEDAFDFRIEFSRTYGSYKSDLPENHPLEELKLYKNAVSTNVHLHMRSSFHFPDERDDNIALHQAFGSGIEDLIQEKWNWDDCVDNTNMLYRIEQRILGIEKEINILGKSLDDGARMQFEAEHEAEKLAEKFEGEHDIYDEDN